MHVSAWNVVSGAWAQFWPAALLKPPVAHVGDIRLTAGVHCLTNHRHG